MADNNSTIIVDVKINAEEADKRAKDLVASIKNIQAEQAKLKSSGDQTSIAYTNNAQSLKNLQAEQKAYITISQNAVGSNNTLRAQLSLLTTQYNSLGKEERDGTAEGKAYEAQIRSITDELKKNESAVGDNRRNVGNYADSLKKSHSTVTGFGDAIKQTGISFGFLPTSVARAGTAITNFVETQRQQIQGFQQIKKLQTEATAATEAAAAATEADAIAQEQLAAGEITRGEADVAATAATIAQTTATEAQTIATNAAAGATGLLSLALKSTGIGFVIAAIASLVEYFGNTNEGAKKLQVVFAELRAVFQQISKVIAPIGKALFDAFSGTNGIDLFTSALKAAYIPLKTIVTSLYDLSQGNFKKAFSDLAAGVVDFGENAKKGILATIGLGKDLANNFEKAGQQANSVAKNLKDVAKNAGDITVQRQKLTAAERDYSTEKLKQQGIVELLTKKLRDANIPEQERTKLAQRAISIRDQIFQKELGYAKQNESLVNKEQALNSKKDLQAIADARNRVQQVINAHANQVQTIENRDSRLTATLDKEAKKHTEEQIKANLEIAKSQLEASKGRLTQRQTEFDQINTDINKRVTLYRKYNNVVEQLERERTSKIQALAKKFADEDTDTITSSLERSIDARIALMQSGSDKEEALQQVRDEKELASLDKQILERNARIMKGEEDKNGVLDRLNKERLDIVKRQQNDAFQKELAADITNDNIDRARIEKALQIQQDAKKRGLDYDKQLADAKKELNNAIIDSASGVTSTIVGLLGENTAAGKIAFAFEQGLTIAKIILNAELEKSAINLAAGETIALNPLSAPFVLGLAAVKDAAITAREVGSVAVIAAQTVGKFVSGKAKGGVQGLDYKSDGKGTALPGYSTYDNLNAYLRAGEGVVVSEAMQDPHTRNLISAINVAYGGRDFSVPNAGRGYALGGTYSGSAQQSASNDIAGQIMVANSNMLNMLSNLKLYVAVTDINDGQNNYAKIVQSGNF
jgi:hypothetical protein